MKKIALAVTLAIASMGAAQAQTPAPSFVQVDPAQPKPLRFVVGGGFTFGGETITTAEYESGGDIDIDAGGGFVFLAGVDYRVSPQFSVQGTIGYHMDNASASNGEVSFTRIPLEFLGYYHVNEKLRVGGGIRYVTGTEFSSSGVAAGLGDYDFDNTTSGVVEMEYMYSNQLGFKLRWVNDKFKEKEYGVPLKGDHVGLLANFYF